MKHTLFILIALMLFVGCAEFRPSYIIPTTEITLRDFKVSRVIDGETFRVTYDGEEMSVRIFGINAPELKEKGGPEAK